MKTIEELAEEYCVKNIPNLKDMHLTISTAFEAGFEKSQEWISVDDELPKEYQFKPFERVLVRDCETEKWKYNLYSYKTVDNTPHFCVDGSWNFCIPYEGNEHLLGTTNNPE